MTDTQWSSAIAEIESLRFQLVNNIMPPSERQDMRDRLIARLRALTKAVEFQPEAATLQST